MRVLVTGGIVKLLDYRSANPNRIFTEGIIMATGDVDDISTLTTNVFSGGQSIRFEEARCFEAIS